MSGNVKEGVEKEVSDALAQGGRLDEGGRAKGPGGVQVARRTTFSFP